MQSQDTMTLRRALNTVYPTENGNRLQSPAVEFEFCIKRMAFVAIYCEFATAMRVTSLCGFQFVAAPYFHLRHDQI
jgi:hypothetical protein